MHYHLPHHKALKTKKRRFLRLNKLIAIVAIASPFIVVPQIYMIYFNHNASGVSKTSWLASVGVSVTWMVYGILHKEKIIVLNSAIGGALALCVFVGTLLYS